MITSTQLSAIRVLLSSFTVRRAGACRAVGPCQALMSRYRSDVPQQARAGKEMIGRWVNKLNSVLVIEQVDSNGIIQGKYQSGKGEAVDFYSLVGALETGILDRSEGRPIGFTTVWKNDKMDAQSVTTWSGQFFSLPDQDIIVANWLLTSATEYTEAWEATRVGQDRFVKIDDGVR